MLENIADCCATFTSVAEIENFYPCDSDVRPSCNCVAATVVQQIIMGTGLKFLLTTGPLFFTLSQQIKDQHKKQWWRRLVQQKQWAHKTS